MFSNEVTQTREGGWLWCVSCKLYIGEGKQTKRDGWKTVDIRTWHSPWMKMWASICETKRYPQQQRLPSPVHYLPQDGYVQTWRVYGLAGMKFLGMWCCGRWLRWRRPRGCQYSHAFSRSSGSVVIAFSFICSPKIITNTHNLHAESCCKLS